MWKLTLNGTNYFLTFPRVYTLGRKGTDIVVQGDKAVSRTHAQFTLSFVDDESILVIIDKSKTGTSVNKEKLTSNRRLNSGDVIELGAQSTQITVTLEKLAFACSGMRKAERHTVKTEYLSKIGARLVDDISDATYLLMYKIDVTAKVMLALVHGIPIVTPDYIRALEKRETNLTFLPDPTSYLPPIVDEELSSSMFDHTRSSVRRKLFDKKTFVFFSSDQHKQASEIIELAGGDSILYSTGPINDSFKKKHAGHYLVLPLEKDYDEEMKRKLKQVADLGLKFVDQNSIGFAILRADVKDLTPRDYAEFSKKSGGMKVNDLDKSKPTSKKKKEK
eukprot:TRINITY_DN2223_c0_g4_i1.p1 TRINITY_DN2223_c0_g4~~TRINITY_DN2223_c0_g4_i1.p1  ORF type:complete len:334 (-),score=64.28 TRINITY_DN2223_c0_g4_i1:104-1105(-)